MEKCFNCDWEGDEEQMVIEPGNLLFYDHMLQNNLKGVCVTRSDMLCPKCGATIKSRRSINSITQVE